MVVAIVMPMVSVVMFVVMPPAVATPMTGFVPFVVVMIDAALIDRRVAHGVASTSVCRLVDAWLRRNGLPDNRTHRTADTAANDGAVTTTHRVTDDDAGYGTKPAANGSTKGIRTGRSGDEQARDEKRSEKFEGFHVAHLLCLVKVMQR